MKNESKIAVKEVKLCNTRKVSKSDDGQPCQKKNWFFTWNNYEEKDIKDLLDVLEVYSTKYVFQEEIGEKGTKHLQGSICLERPMRWTELKLSKEIHWEKTKSVKKSFDYCTKEETRNGRVWTKGFKFKEPLELVIPNYDWQLKILDIIKEKPNTRTINWFWSVKGDLGKSQFAKYCVSKFNACFVDRGRKSDIMNHLFNYLQNNDERIKLLIIDVPRDDGNKVCYKSLESIKNGMIFNSKYECGQCLFNSPHVFVFANEPPDEWRMSADRWNIIQIDKEKEEN